MVAMADATARRRATGCALVAAGCAVVARVVATTKALKMLMKAAWLHGCAGIGGVSEKKETRRWRHD